MIKNLFKKKSKDKTHKPDPEAKYLLVRIDSGYGLFEYQKPIDLTPTEWMDNEVVTELYEELISKSRKLIATNEVMDDNSIREAYRLRLSDCNEAFNIGEIRPPRVSDKYENAEYGSKEELCGIMEMLRLQMYNYLSGKTTHESFLRTYHNYETFLSEHGIIKSNDWEFDDNEMDEYFNVWLENPELSRELNNHKTKLIVRVTDLKDKDGYVSFEKI